MKRQIESIAQILEAKILESTEGEPLKTIKNVYRGDPVVIPRSSLPAIVVRTPNAAIDRRDNIRDQRIYAVQIRYVFDVRGSMWDSDQKNNAFEIQANDLFIEENEDGSLKDNCLCNILRANKIGNQTLGAIGKLQTSFNVIWE